jgi:hypothetical protein
MKRKGSIAVSVQSPLTCSIVSAGPGEECEMSLSEHERQLLAQMEEALSADDPRLVSTLTGNRLYPGRNRFILGVTLVLAGLATLFGGLIAKTTPIGILGFVISLVGVTLAISAISGLKGLHVPRRRGRTTLNSRLEDRWERRNFDN